jgi:uncharacterized protein (DUF983 family)
MSEPSLWPDPQPIRLALRNKCPRCGEGGLYKDSFLSTAVRDECPVCGLKLSGHDSGDGPAVFLIFVLGFLIVPLALLLEWLIHPPLWLQGVIWGIVALTLTLGALRPLKAYIIALQYKHRPGDWKD